MLLSDRTKVVRGVLGFLTLCAVVGFAMGIRGALPRGGDEDTEPQGPPAEATSNVVVEATPVQEAAAPAANEATNAAAANEDTKQAEEEKAATKAEETKPVPPPAAAPPEEAPSNDAIGQVLQQNEAPADNAPTPPTLY